MYTATLCNISCIMSASNSISNASKSVSAHVKLTVYQLKFGVRQRPLLVFSLDSVAYVGALSPVTKIMHMANRHCSLFRDVGLESPHRCKGGFKGVP